MRHRPHRPLPTRLALGATLLVAALGAGCGDDGSDGKAAGSGEGLRVSMTEFAYAPDPIVVPADGKLDVVNDGAVAHDLVIGELGKGTIELAPGQNQVLDLSDQPAGTYRAVCDLPGHIEAGMVTEVTIG